MYENLALLSLFLPFYSVVTGGLECTPINGITVFTEFWSGSRPSRGWATRLQFLQYPLINQIFRSGLWLLILAA